MKNKTKSNVVIKFCGMEYSWKIASALKLLGLIKTLNDAGSLENSVINGDYNNFLGVYVNSDKADYFFNLYKNYIIIKINSILHI